MDSTYCAVAFEGIYQRNEWGDGDGSGGGSEPVFAQGVSDILLLMIKRFNITSMLDAPCGACKWTSAFLKQVEPGFTYTGIDVSETAIRRARMNLNDLNDLQNTMIQLHDLTVSPFPGYYDLVMCRDTLQHLSFADVFKVLRNFKQMAVQGNAKLFAIGSYIKYDGNVDGKTPTSYTINLLEEPFSLQPDQIIAEMHPETFFQQAPKHLFIYKASTVATWDI